MPYTFPPDLQSLLQKHLTLGNYATEEDVLRDALRALDDHQTVLQDIRTGLADMETGRGRSLDEIDVDLRAKHNIPRTT